MKWIMSGGGPLICLEDRLRTQWAGNDLLTIPNPNGEPAASDYEIAGRLEGYLNVLPLQTGNALIMGDMPLDTAVWQEDTRSPLIVRIFWAEPDFEGEAILKNMKGSLFDNPIERVAFHATSKEFIIFDSAYAGSDLDRPEVAFSMAEGRYEILTKQFDPDDNTSLLLHKFVPRETW